MAVYPRVGGGNGTTMVENPNWKGLSPRGRGKRVCRRKGCGADRSIPAWAGETPSSATSLPLRSVYPRVGGGNSAAALFLSLPLGLSPRGRGKRFIGYEISAAYRSIPAWAGETWFVAKSLPKVEVYPRVGGGNFTTN